MLPLYSLIYSSVLRIHSDSDFLILALPIPLVFTILVEEGPTAAVTGREVRAVLCTARLCLACFFAVSLAVWLFHDAVRQFYSSSARGKMYDLRTSFCSSRTKTISAPVTLASRYCFLVCSRVRSLRPSRYSSAG